MPEIFTSIPLESTEIWVKVWKIEEPIGFFQTIPLAWYESIIAIKKSEIQQIESIAARFCLHDICKTLRIEDPKLINNEHGAPQLENSMYEISLTHSYPFVAAIISQNKSIGIDIEKKGRSIGKIAPRFLNKLELDRWAKDPLSLTLAWSMKESIYKACKTPGLSFQKTINLPEKWNMPFETPINSEKVSIYWEIFEDFVLTIAQK